MRQQGFLFHGKLPQPFKEANQGFFYTFYVMKLLHNEALLQYKAGDESGTKVGVTYPDNFNNNVNAYPVFYNLCFQFRP